MNYAHTKLFPYREMGILIVFLAAITFFVRPSIGQFMWNVLGAPRTALLLTQDARFAMEIGNYYFNGGDYDLEQAERAYQKALSLDPSILWGHYQLARIYFVKTMFDHAIEEINQELAVRPENLRSLYMRGLIYGYQGNLAKAEEDFKAFIQWAPKEWAGYNDLCWILLKEKKYEEARAIAMLGIQNAPYGDQNAWLWNNRGVAELNLKRYQEAESSLKRTLILADQLTLAQWQRAYSGNNPSNAESGLAQFKSAIRSNLDRAQK